jgi:hypothetical protein
VPRLTRILLIALAALAATGAPAPAHDILPDLDQVAPSDVSVRSERIKGRKHFRLGFASASANVGNGPLTLHGYRRSLATGVMRVDQLIQQSTGDQRLVRDVGTMSYIVHPDHRHWHFMGFERYEIRRARDFRLMRGDRKTGFCLGDRYAIPQAPSLVGFNPVPLQGDTCGLGMPGLLGVFAGISTGWADRYEGHIEGQYIDITGLKAGRYVLVHRVNPEARIVENDYSNNSSSALLQLSWPLGRHRLPRLTVRKVCYSSAYCPRWRNGA